MKKESEISGILENLDNLEVNLLNYEESMNSGNPDNSLIHFIFRFAHNLKSTLAMVDKIHSSELIHIIESNFDLLRKGESKPIPELLNNSLLGVDLIKMSLITEEENILDLETQINKLKSIYNSLLENKGDVQRLSIKTNQAKSEKINKLIDQNYSFYRIEKLISSGLTSEEFETLSIYEDIKEIGDLISIEPSYQNISKDKAESVIYILFATKIEESEIQYHIFDPFKKVIIEKIEFEDEKKETGEIKKSEGLRILIVEDDFLSRSILQSFLSEYGTCEIAVNGKEAILAFKMRLDEGIPYHLICLDIMMPEMDGHHTLVYIREYEKTKNIFGLLKVKIIMTTALDDYDHVMSSFREQCDGYLVKPLFKPKITAQLKKLNLLE